MIARPHTVGLASLISCFCLMHFLVLVCLATAAAPMYEPHAEKTCFFVMQKKRGADQLLYQAG